MKKVFYLTLLILLTNNLYSQTGSLNGYQLISNVYGGFGNVLDGNDRFGAAAVSIGDINKDGVPDLAVSAFRDDDGGTDKGAVYILFMNGNKTVNYYQKISATQGGLSTYVNLSAGDLFGTGLSDLGDIDGDGIPDIVVAAQHDNSGGTNTGAIYIINLDTNGTVKGATKISKLTGYGSSGLNLTVGGNFGCEIACLGDINSDGVQDIAVGAYTDPGGGTSKGAVYVLKLKTTGKVKSYFKIYDGITNFNAPINNQDYFGVGVGNIGDRNNDGITDLGVGAYYDGTSNEGAIYIIKLDTNGVKGYTKISNGNGGLPYGTVSNNFGISVRGMTDLNGDGIDEIMVGASYGNGSMWILYMNSSNTVSSYTHILSSQLNTYGNRIGGAVFEIGDMDNDGYPEYLTGGTYYDSKKGAIWIYSVKSIFKLAIQKTNSSCSYMAVGKAKAIPTLGTAPYTFLWSTGATTDSITGLSAGTYTVTVTDALGKKQVRSVIIANTPSVEISTSNNDTICSGSSVNITTSITGGKPSYTYHWNQGLSNASSHSVSPPATTTYTVYATDANGCSSDTNDITITVNPLPATSFSGLNVAYCSNANAVNLTGSPSSGVFSGPGTTGSVFNPAAANTGINQIVYSYTDANGCVGRDTNTTNIIAAPDVQFTGISNAYCTNYADVVLAGKATPAGGSFWVNSVSKTVFSPSTMGAGTYHIRYKVTNGSGCTDEDSMTTFVNPAPTASFSGLAASYCENNLSVALNGSPSGGTFSGPGISGTSFYPANAGLGTKNIKYIYSNMFGCSDTAVHSTVVNATTPLTVSTTKNIFCNNDAAVSISVSPSGGTLSGSGVNNTAKTFDPASAGTGSKTITYTFINPYGCTSVETHNVTVNAPASLSISGLAASYCANNGVANISGSPAGGTFFGSGVGGSTFNPVAAGVGTHAVSYRYDNGCVDTLTQNVVVNALPTVSISGLAASYCESVTSVSLSGSPSGGSFYGPGVNYGGSIFNPEDAGPGTHTISYISPLDANGCKDTSSQSVVVNGLPNISFGSMASNQCIDNAAVSLSASPSGGSFTGTGVSGTSFNPATAGVGTHQVYYSVSDANSCSNTDSFAFVVHALPNITFNVGSSCVNIASMSLSATPAGGSFGGSYVTGSTFSPSNAGVGSHQVTYSYTDAYSCSNVDTQSIVVNALPAVSFSLSNSDFCIDANSISLSATPSGGSFSGSGISGTSFSPSAAGMGSHNLVYSYTDGNLCSNSDTAVAVVHALPVVSISNYNTTNCSNNPNDTLTGLPSGGTFSGTGMTGSIFSPSSAGAGTHQIVYSYSDSYQCSNSDTISIVVNTPPVISIVSGLNATNCQNDAPYALNITPSGGNYNVSFVVNDTFFPGLAPLGYMGYIYSYTDANGCSAAMGDSAFVYANPTIDAGSDTLLPCNSNGVSIGENPQSGNTYIWSPVAGLNNPFIANPVANPWVDTTVFVVVKTNIATSCSRKDSVMITLPQLPSVSISGDTAICFGDTVHLMASGTPNFAWKYGITGANFDMALPITQYISVIGTDTNNCSDQDSVIVLVNPLPKPNLGNDTTIFMDSLILNPGSFSSYQWNTNATTPTITVHSSDSPGLYTYSVLVENQFGCFGSDTIVVSITTDIATAENDLQLKAYPNPTTDWLNIDLSARAKIGAYSIYDDQGKLIGQKQINANLKNLKIDFNAYARGKYYIRISINNKIQTLPIFVQ